MNETYAAAQMRTFLEKGFANLREALGDFIPLPNCNMGHINWTSKHPGGGYIYSDRMFYNALWQEMNSAHVNQPLENQFNNLYHQMYNQPPNAKDMDQFKDDLLYSMDNLRFGGPYGECSSLLHDCTLDDENPKEKIQQQAVVVLGTQNAQIMEPDLDFLYELSNAASRLKNIRL